MMKWLVRKFIPSAKSLAGYAADAIQKGVNGFESERRAAVEKYASMANESAALSVKLTEMLKDGTIDDAERDELQEMLLPLMEKVVALV